MRIIIDTDAGVDDALALQLALAYPMLSIEAITTVTGNTDVDTVIRNVNSTLVGMSRTDIPVFRGADRPLISAWKNETTDVHGNDGMGDWADRPVGELKYQEEHAVLALVRLINQYPGEITLIALAPMTNIALAFRLDPTLPSKIKNLVWMGGAIYGRGNTSTYGAEFNVQVDPEAVQIVLSAFPDSIMISWEISVKYEFKWQQFDDLIALNANTYTYQFFKGVTAFWSHMGRDVFTTNGFVMPDPLAVAVALYPDMITATEHRYVAVELAGGLTRGVTAVDWAKLSNKAPNVQVVTEVEPDALLDLYRRLLTQGHL